MPKIGIFRTNCLLGLCALMCIACSDDDEAVPYPGVVQIAPDSAEVLEDRFQTFEDHYENGGFYTYEQLSGELVSVSQTAFNNSKGIKLSDDPWTEELMAQEVPAFVEQWSELFNPYTADLDDPDYSCDDRRCRAVYPQRIQGYLVVEHPGFYDQLKVTMRLDNGFLESVSGRLPPAVKLPSPTVSFADATSALDGEVVLDGCGDEFTLSADCLESSGLVVWVEASDQEWTYRLAHELTICPAERGETARVYYDAIVGSLITADLPCG